jgi:plasmid stabilization system protein ParE
MAFRVDFTELAVEDLESISTFIGADNPEAASRVCRRMYEAAMS